MKKTLSFILICLCALPALIAQDAAVQIEGEAPAAAEEPITAEESPAPAAITEEEAPPVSKPQKIAPLTENGFELIQGTRIEAPIDTERFLSSAQKAAQRMGWKILGSEEGRLSVQLQRRNWRVAVDVCYAEDEYWFQYVDSFNVGASPEKGSIYYGYYRWWIPNLDRSILAFYKKAK